MNLSKLLPLSGHLKPTETWSLHTLGQFSSSSTRSNYFLFLRWIHDNCFCTGFVGLLEMDEQPILGLILSTRADGKSEYVHSFCDLAVSDPLANDLADNGPFAAYFHLAYINEWYNSSSFVCYFVALIGLGTFWQFRRTIPLQ